MANLLLIPGRNLPLIAVIRRLSSFNNNRTKSGIVGILNNDDYWSENNWSEFAKQFSKSVDFPLPGQVGIIFEAQVAKTKEPSKKSTQSHQNRVSTIYENLDYLLHKPLAHENQIIRLKEAAGGIYYEDKMDKQLFSNEETNSKVHFELKAYKCPISLMKDFQNYFRSNSLGETPLTLITVSFKTENDMATWSGDVDAERELLIKQFVDTAQELCSNFEREGFWADFIDPCSGRPTKSSFTHASFYETDERYRQLGFEIIDHGCCKIISHHKWGTKTYVGCVITNAEYNSKLINDLSHKTSQ